MVETENFIKEVSEEVKKDRLFRSLRRYKWILAGIILSIILVVTGYEYYKYNRKINSELNGRLLFEYIQNLDNKTNEEVNIPIDSYIGSVAKLHKAKFFVGKQDLDSARKLYEEVAESSGSNSFLKKYSMLMLYLLSPAETLIDKDKIKILDQLSAPDSPFQILALEQKVLFFLKVNDFEKAKYHISLIIGNPGVTTEQLERIKEVKELYEFD